MSGASSTTRRRFGRRRSCGAQLVGIATVVTELSPEAARGLAKLHALVRR